MLSRVIVALLLLGGTMAPAGTRTGSPPARLADTGLYEPGTMHVRQGVRTYTPQYPLWSDGAAKQRWIWLPPGTAIDASEADAWQFPVGTRFWKQLSTGRRIETRYMEKLEDGSWRFASYVWNEAGTDATLAPEAGLSALHVDVARRHDVPSTSQCRACHHAAEAPVLGFTALQLSWDRDPLAPHAEARRPDDLDLADPRALDWFSDLSLVMLIDAPRIAARNAVERAARGYLMANWGANPAMPLANADPAALALIEQWIAGLHAEQPGARTPVPAPQSPAQQ